MEDLTEAFGKSSLLQEDADADDESEEKRNGMNCTSLERNKVDGNDRCPGPILISQQDWELTWPIWHLLPIAERRRIAHDHGGLSIGEFEEYMTLSKALNANNNNGTYNTHLTPDQMYDNTILYKQEQRPEYYGLPTVAQSHKPFQTLTNDSKDTDDINDQDSSSSISSDLDNNEALDHDQFSQNNRQTMLKQGGYMTLLLPQEMQDYVMMFLNIDYYAQCALVCKSWQNFTRTEPHVYKLICQRVYLQQSKRKALHVSRFQNSYRNMLLQRPRVKVGTGLYVLKYSHIKKIQRDMWTEVPVGAVLESTYYRYLYFHENQKVLYALTSAPPFEMIARFLKMKRTGEPDKAAVWAEYQVQKYEITVKVSHPWHDVQMHLSILHTNNHNCHNHGTHNISYNHCFDTLAIDKHMSSRSGDFDEYYSRDLVHYDVPSEPFRFLRDWRM